jgi:hypothetical protein
VNSLSQALNREKFAKEGSFAKKVGDLTVSGTIKKIGGDERGEYEGLFCVENVPFVHYRWVGSGSVVEVRRSMKLDPFIQKEDPDYGLDSRRHVRYTDGNVKEFEMSEHGAPSSDDDQGTVAETSHAVAKVNQAGSIEYHSVHSRRKDMQEPQTFIADAYSTGRYNQDGSGRVLLHDSKLRIFVPLCQTDFSAQNLATPGWCFEFTFGPNISDIKTRHSRIDASRILTGDLQAAGIGQVSDLKKVEVLGNHSTIEGCPPP